MSIHAYPAGSAYPQLGLDPTLQALADLNTSADTAPYFTAVDQAALMTVTPFARSLLDDPDASGWKATLDFGSGQANKVGIWSDTDTLTYDTALHWDSVNNRLGIGTDTPDYPLHVQGDSWLDGNVSIGTPDQTAPLTFGGVKGHKLHLYSDDPRFYGIAVEGEGPVYLPPDHLQIFVPKEAGNDTYIALGGYNTDTYEFEPLLTVQSLSGNVGIGTSTPTNALDIRATSYATDFPTELFGIRLRLHGTAVNTGMAALRIEPPTLAGGATSGYYAALQVLDTPAFTGTGTIGLHSLITGASNWNINASGTAPNYFGGNIGIGTTAITAPLTFATSLGQKIHVYANGNTRYGFGMAGGTLQVFSQNGGGHVDIGTMSVADGTTFTPHLVVSDVRVTSNVNFQSSLRTGLGYPPPANIWLRSGSASIDSLYLGGGDTAPRWALDCIGQAHIAQLGVYYGPESAAAEGVDLRVYRSRIDLLSVGWPAVANYELAVNRLYAAGVVHLNSPVGIGGYAPSAYGLRCSTAHFDHIAVNEAPVGGWYISTYNLLVRANIQADSILMLGTSQLNNIVGIGGAPNANYHLTNHGQSYLYGLVGVGYPPVAGWNLTAGTCYIGATWCDAQAGFGGVYDARFNVRCYGAMYCDGQPYSGVPGPWAAYSDRRLKQLHGEIPHPLETMCALHGLLYEYSDTDMGRPAGVRMGVVAQEVEAVVPEWVGELSGFKTTQLAAFEALTIESFKALAARVAALEGA